MANYDLNSITHGNDTYNLKDNSKIPLSGTNALSGSIIPSTDNAYDLGSSTYGFANIFTQYVQGNTQKELSLFSSNNTYDPWNHGAFLGLFTNDYSADSARIGTFALHAVDSGNNHSALIGTPNGTLTWGTKNVAMQEDVIPRSGGAVITGTNIGRADNTGNLDICGGTSWENGGFVALRGKNISGLEGVVIIGTNDGSSSCDLKLFPNGTLTWSGQPIQYTSDQRLKQQISEIDDKLLDAWEDVELSQFKYNDAVDQKGDNARLHTGYVVQQIDEACKSHGVDISAYGLYCHEEYEEETREVENEDGTKTTEVVRPASEHYSLRYTEALVVECAYLRKQIELLQERLNKLEEK